MTLSFVAAWLIHRWDTLKEKDGRLVDFAGALRVLSARGLNYSRSAARGLNYSLQLTLFVPEKKASIRAERDSDLTTGTFALHTFCTLSTEMTMPTCTERQEMRRESEISRMVSAPHHPLPLRLFLLLIPF